MKRHTPDSPVIFALHGVNRNLAYTLQTWTPLADRLGFLLVVPSFDNRRFPGTFSYAQGGVTNGRLPRWSSYNAILPIFAEVSRHYGVKRTGFRIYGHSAGAQFLHRFLYFHPEAPVERAVISMAGWYTLPDEDVRWPYGLGGTAIDQNTLKILTQHEIVIQVGTSAASKIKQELGLAMIGAVRRFRQSWRTAGSIRRITWTKLRAAPSGVAAPGPAALAAPWIRTTYSPFSLWLSALSQAGASPRVQRWISSNSFVSSRANTIDRCGPRSAAKSSTHSTTRCGAS